MNGSLAGICRRPFEGPAAVRAKSETSDHEKWAPRCVMMAGVTGNKETICQGRFWEGRKESVKLFFISCQETNFSRL